MEKFLIYKSKKILIFDQKILEVASVLQCKSLLNVSKHAFKHFLPVHCHCDAWLLKWRTYQNWPLTLLRLIKLNKIPVKMIYFNYIRNNIRFYENVYLKDLIMLT